MPRSVRWWTWPQWPTSLYEGPGSLGIGGDRRVWHPVHGVGCCSSAAMPCHLGRWRCQQQISRIPTECARNLPPKERAQGPRDLGGVRSDVRGGVLGGSSLRRLRAGGGRDGGGGDGRGGLAGHGDLPKCGAGGRQGGPRCGGEAQTCGQLSWDRGREFAVALYDGKAATRGQTQQPQQQRPDDELVDVEEEALQPAGVIATGEVEDLGLRRCLSAMAGALRPAVRWTAATARKRVWCQRTHRKMARPRSMSSRRCPCLLYTSPSPRD